MIKCDKCEGHGDTPGPQELVDLRPEGLSQRQWSKVLQAAGIRASKGRVATLEWGSSYISWPRWREWADARRRFDEGEFAHLDEDDGNKEKVEEDEDDDSHLCSNCQGSGGGPDPETYCQACGGSGFAR